MDDPKYGEVPLAVSVEYAQDLNVLRYHDRAFGTATANNPNRGYRDDAGVLHDCTISRWKYRPAAGFNNSNGTPATPLQEEPTWPNGDENCLTYKAMNEQPVVCQSCHCTPALDLTQVGPIGGAVQYDDGTQNGGTINCPTGTGGADSNYGNCVGNGRTQRNKVSMSHAIHTRHSGFSNTFPMPSPDNTAARRYIVKGAV